MRLLKPLCSQSARKGRSFCNGPGEATGTCWVRALPRGYEAAEDSLDGPALEAWARDVAEASTDRSLASRRVGRYVIASRLGAGGIGTCGSRRIQN